MVTKEYTSKNGALTLKKEDVEDIYLGDRRRYMKTHDDGWTIIGDIKEDYYEWVNEFIAIHPKYGKVWGDFEDKVFADSMDGLNDFYTKHTPVDWDYGDI